MSMVELSKLNHCKNLAQWQQLVQDCRHSGMTVKAWCAQNGISEKSYYYRQKKVWESARQQKIEQNATSTNAPGDATLPSIIPCVAPIATATVQHHAPALVLRSDKWTVEVNAGCDPELLRLVLRTVK